MTPITADEHITARNAIIGRVKAEIAELDARLLLGRQYPDGFIVHREVPMGDKYQEISGPIFQARVESEWDWYEDNNRPSIWYDFHVTQPASYKDGGDYTGLPAGKWEVVLEAHLLNGTGPDGTIPQQLPPADEHMNKAE